MLQIEFRDRLHSGRDDEKARVFRDANGRSWAIATNFSMGPDVSFRGEAEGGRAAESAASVENDPELTLRAANYCIAKGSCAFVLAALRKLS
jgi:hypothetical protein